MWSTRTIARFMDARNTAEGKFLSVLLSVLLVFSFLNVTMFTDFANAEDDVTAEEVVAETESMPAEDPEAEEPADEPVTEEVTEPEAEEPETEEVTEPEQPAPAEEPEADEAAEEVITPEDDIDFVEDQPAETSNLYQARASKVPVYVYLELQGDGVGDFVEGLNVKPNEHGYYTIGKIWVELPSPSSSEVKTGKNYIEDYRESVIEAVKNGIERYLPNAAVDISDLPDENWTNLVVSNGADKYVPSGTMTWHLDGYMNISNVVNYRVQHVDVNGEIIAKKEEGTTRVGTSITAANHLAVIDGYVYSPTLTAEKNDGSTSIVAKRAGDNVLTIVYEKSKYTVSYDLDGGQVPDGVETNFTELEYGTATPELTSAPTKDGYTFLGWDKTIAETVTEDATYIAQWERSTFTITYNLNQGSLPGDDEETVFTANSGDKTPTLSQDPVRFGYTFAGWSPSVADVVTTDATYIAQWKPIQYKFVIEADSNEVVYDGSYHGAAGLKNVCEIPNRNGEKGVKVVVGGETFYITGYHAAVQSPEKDGQVKNAGDYALVPQKGSNQVVIYDSNGKEFDNGFVPTIELKAGTLKIQKRTVTLTSANLSKEYDGTALTNGNAALATEEGWANGEGATYSFTGSQTLVGNSANAFSYTLNSNTDAGNYNIQKSEGTLTVSKRNAAYEVTVTANSTTATYDGTQKTASGFVNEGENGIPVTANGQTFYVMGLTSSASGTNVADSQATIPVIGTAVVKDAAGNDVTAQFNVKVVPGKLAIEKAPLTIASADLSKQYDGTALTNGDEPMAVELGWAKGEGATYTFDGSVSQPGENAPNSFEVVPNEGTSLDNYELTLTEGQLSITNREALYKVTVVANSVSAIYDGSEKVVSGFQGNEVDFTPTMNAETSTKAIPVTAENGQTYYVTGLTSEAKGTNVVDSVASIAVTGTSVVYDAAGNNVSAQFDVKVIPGSLTINKRTVTLTSANLSKEYDGTALTNGNAALATEEGWANGEGATYSFTGSQTLVGNSANAFSYTLNSNTDAGNYNIQKSEGTLTVSKRNAAYEVTVTANSTTATYDGTQKTASGFVNEGENGIPVTANGQTFYVMGLTSSASGTNVADSQATIPVIGTAVVKDAAGNDVTAQFNVKVVPGKLAIEKAPLTIKVASLTKPYDGTPLTNADAKDLGVEVNDRGVLSEEGWVNGEEKDVRYMFYASALLPNSVTNNVFEIFWNGVNKDNYSLTTWPGILKVTNRDALYTVQVEGKSLETTYSGLEQSVEGFIGETENGIPVVASNGLTYYVKGLTSSEKATAATAKHDVAYSGIARVYDEAGNDVSSQFNVEIKPGTFEIKKAPLTLISASLTKPYDGTPLTNADAKDLGVEVNDRGMLSEEGWVNGEGESVTFDFFASTLLPNSYVPNGYTINWNGVDKGNYDLKQVMGGLRVTNRDAAYQVTVFANSFDGTYDGTEKEAIGFVGETERGIAVEADGRTYYVTGLTSQASGTNVSDSLDMIPVTGTAVVKDAEGNDVSSEFNVNVEAGHFKISRRVVEIVGEQDEVFNGALQVMKGTSLRVSKGSLAEGHSYRLNNMPAGVDAGEYTVSTDTADMVIFDSSNQDVTGNYEFSLNAKLTIRAQSIVPPIEGEPSDPNYEGVTVDPLDDLTYNGLSQKQMPTLRDAEGNKLSATNFNYSWSEDTVNAGLVTVTITGVRNYTGSITVEYRILPREVVVYAMPAGKIYGAADPTFTYEFDRDSRPLGNDKVGDITVVRTNDDENVGTYPDVLEPQVSNANSNYKVSVVRADFVIDPANSNRVDITGINSTNAQGMTKVYDGNPASIAASAVQPGSTLEYSYDGGETWTSENREFTNAGTYSVKVRATNPNYETVEADAQIVIYRARAIINVANATKVAGTQDPMFTGSVTGLVNANDLGTILYVRNDNSETVGTHPLTATYVRNANYDVEIVNGVLTITAAPTTVVPPTPPVVTPPTPAPTPAPGVAPAPVATPVAVTPAPAAPAAPAAAVPAPAAPAGETIDDDATPQAAAPAAQDEAPTAQQIEDDGTPMGAFDEPHCWVHWVMLIGILLTAAYGLVVVRRRLHMADDVDDYEKKVLGIEDEAEPAYVPLSGSQTL